MSIKILLKKNNVSLSGIYYLTSHLFLEDMQIRCYVKIAVQTTFGCDANGKKTSVALGREKCALLGALFQKHKGIRKKCN